MYDALSSVEHKGGYFEESLVTFNVLTKQNTWTFSIEESKHISFV